MPDYVGSGEDYQLVERMGWMKFIEQDEVLF